MAIVVTDTSVLINFLKIDRMDVIGRHPDGFIATDHVAAEIAAQFRDQQARYARALAAGHIQEQVVHAVQEVAIFLRLSQGTRLGAGECSAIAVALNRGYGLAIDDARALKAAMREAGLVGSALRVFRTQDIMVELIRSGALAVADADAILADWANNHRFRLGIASFADLLRGQE